jgi:hypothetical protein
MNKLKRNISVLAVFTVGAGLPGLSSIVSAQIPPQTIYARVNNSSGTIHVIGPNDTCNGNKHHLAWNNVGPSRAGKVTRTIWRYERWVHTGDTLRIHGSWPRKFGNLKLGRKEGLGWRSSDPWSAGDRI